MQRLYIGPSRDVVRMELICGFQPRRGYVPHVQPDGRHHASRHAPVIHRLILSDLLSFPNRVAGHVYIPELLYFCLFGEAVHAGVRLEVPLCPDHVVVGQRRYTLMVRAPLSHHRIEVAAYTSGSIWLVVQGCIPWLPGH